jgi:hypothetical protein
MSVATELSKQALLILKQTSGLDEMFKEDWSFEDLASMDTLNQEDLAECILYATLRGSESMVRTLVERRGMVPIEVQTLQTTPPTYLLNGQPVEFNGLKFFYDIDQYDTVNKINSLLEMIVELGMKGLIDLGDTYPLLLRNVCPSPFEDKYNRFMFDGSLPELSGGVVSRPELAIAMSDRSATSASPEAYQPMLCWASEDMVRQFSENLIPLRPFQNVPGHGTLAEWKAKSGEPGNLEFDCISIGIEPTEKNSDYASCLIGPMAPELSKKGFDDIGGKLLCETTTDFLLQFETSACIEQNVRAATEFVGAYCPILIMAKKALSLYQGKGVDVPLHAESQVFVTDMQSNFDTLFSLLNVSSETSERAKAIMTQEQWRAVAKKGQSSIASVSLLALWQCFGIDNASLQLCLEGGLLAYLAQNGYRFSSDTRVFEDEDLFREYSSRDGSATTTGILIGDYRIPFVPDYFDGQEDASLLSQAIVVFQKILSSNLWPTTQGRPLDVKDALKQCNGLNLDDFESNQAMLLRAYLLNEGVDACVNAVTSAQQWQKLMTVFGSNEMTPYLGKMPKSARGGMLESVLGL